MKNLILLLFGLMTCSTIWGQVLVNEDPIIAAMMVKFTELNKARPKLSGWRVQIASTNDRRKIEEMRTLFLIKYPEVPADWVHQKPFYKLRAGAFLTKLDAMHLLYLIRKDFPAAYAATDDNIHPKELIGLK